MQKIGFWGRALCFSALAVLWCAAAWAQEDLWVGFSFDDTVEPTAGAAKDAMKVTFTRQTKLVAPDGTVAAPDAPLYVPGVEGKGLYMGDPAENLLSPELADAAFPEGKVQGIEAVGEAAIEQVTGPGAWHGDSCLKVKARPQAGPQAGGGISITMAVPGETDERGAPALFVFSLYVKADFNAALHLRMNAPVDTVSDTVTVGSPKEWTRYDACLFADKPMQARVTLTTAAGGGEFMVDGLQLERNRKAMGTPGNFPYGQDFTANSWAPGGQTVQHGRYYVAWQGAQFPIAEGTLSVWLRPFFRAGDCQGHGVAARSHVYYQLCFQGYGQYSFYRRNEGKDGEQPKNPWGEVRVARPAGLRTGEWCLLTATWSNQAGKTILYFNGEPVGDCQSFNQTDAPANNYLFIGGWDKDGLNGTLDNLRVYSRAFTQEEIGRAYFDGMRKLGAAK